MHPDVAVVVAFNLLVGHANCLLELLALLGIKSAGVETQLLAEHMATHQARRIINGPRIQQQDSLILPSEKTP